MKIKWGFLHATVCGAALFSAGILTTTTNNAFAACGTGGQCSVANGTNSNFTGGNYWATDLMSGGTPIGNIGQAAFYAANPGSSIEAAGVVVQPRQTSLQDWEGIRGYKAQAEDGGLIAFTNSTLTGGWNGLLAQGNNARITMSGGSINVERNAATVRNTSRLVFNGGVAVAVTDNNAIAVDAYNNSRVVFEDASVSATGASAIGVRARDNADISFTNTDITNSGSSSHGINADGNTNTTLTGGSIQATGASSAAIYAQGNATIALDSTDVVASGFGSDGLYVMENTKIEFKNGTLEASGQAVWGVRGGGDAEIFFDTATILASGSFTNGLRLFSDIKTELKDSAIEASGWLSRGVVAQGDSTVLLNDTNIAASGDTSEGLTLNDSAMAIFKRGTIEASGLNSSGVHVNEQASLRLEDATLNATGINANALVFGGFFGSGATVDMVGGVVSASAQATAIKAEGNGPNHQLNVSNAIIDGGRLADAQDNSRLNINVDNSVLSGFANVAFNANLSMNLQDSLWNIRHDTVGAGSGASSISSLNFANSTLRFDAPVGGIYQSLRVGAGNPTTFDTYNAGSNSWLEINTFINAGGAPANQFTDRLLVEGNVSGQTVLKIHEMVGSTGAVTSSVGTNGAHEGISLIQVSGASRPDSFVIDGGYTTLSKRPYVYQLYAFGDGTPYGSADSAQKMVGGINHWDYRLQNEFIRTSKGWAVQVAPQMASYLTAPTALFQAGISDTANLQSRLGEMRQAALSEEALADGEKAARMRGNFFLRGFGGDYNYHSNLNAIHYGYDADIRYAAVQAGGNLAGFDTAAGQMLFGLAGSYGDLSFSPERLDSRKTSMDVWSASAYASWLGNNGFYVDTILSYGGFSGAVSTRRYDHTASLKGNSFTASVEVGHNFALANGWAIEPQAQLTYQRLSFDNQYDIDDFAVVLGSPDQWVGRIGGRVSKDVAVESVERLQLYGKLNLIHGFGSGDRVFLGDDFHIGKFGTNIEAGVGLSLDMTKNASLYGDVSYQSRIGKGGSNGLSLNGGLRFQF